MIAMVITLMLMILIGSSVMTIAFEIVYKAFCLAISGMSFEVQVVAKLVFLVLAGVAAVYCVYLLNIGYISLMGLK